MSERVEVVCEHAEQCAIDGTDTECWHTINHAPWRFQAVAGQVICFDCRDELICAATGRRCRCLPV